MSCEDSDLHSDLLAAYRQIEHQAGVIAAQAELVQQLLGRRQGERTVDAVEVSDDVLARGTGRKAGQQEGDGGGSWRVATDA